MAEAQANVGPDLSAIQRWPTPQSKTWTRNFLAAAEGDRNIFAVVAVGSSVRSDVPSMDLDLVVIARVPAKIKAKPPIEIDLRTYPADQVDALIKSGNDLLGWAVVYGRVLFQRDAFWDSVLARWRENIPLPSPEIAIQRAADSLRRFDSMVEVGDGDAALEQAVSYVTHLARAELLKRNQYPASRPELPRALRTIGYDGLATCLEKLIRREVSEANELVALLDSVAPHDKRRTQ